MNKRLFFIIGGLIFLCAFYVFSWQVKNERFKQLNFDTTIRLQDNVPKRLDGYWENISFFVEPVPSIVLVGVLTLAALFNFRKRKFYFLALLIPVLFGLVVVTEIYGKAKVESPAPPFFMLKNPTTIFPMYHVQESYSYPSGHAGRSLFLAIILIFTTCRYTRKWRYLIPIITASMGYVAVVSIGKVYLGHHWLSDIIGGYLVAMAFGSFAGFILWEHTSFSALREAINTFPRNSKQKKLLHILEEET